MKSLYLLLNIAITGITIIIYAVCLSFLFNEGDYLPLTKALVIPLFGYIVCTVLRIVINAPRPYEKEEVDNLLNKKTTGKSFPSRHVFSIFIIAMTCFYYIPVFGIILYVLGVVLAILRVLSHVHYIRDVVCGAILAIAVGSLLYLI